MENDSRIRITERSIGLGESTIPSRADDFIAWVTRQLSDHDDATAVEVSVTFTEDQTLADALAFLEDVDASTDLHAEMSDVTLVLRVDEE